MTDRPLVSIVTPTLNQGPFIEATIRSVMGQTYDAFEHIVIDAGSTDGALDTLRANEGRYPLWWTSETDRGMYDGLNKGFRRATGDILCYLNSDDLFLPWTLEVVVAAFEADPSADMVIGDVLGLRDGDRLDIRFQTPYRFDFLRYASSLVQPGVFWRRGIALRTGEFDASLRLAGDLDYWLRMGPDVRVRQIDEVVAIERDHALTKRSRLWTDLGQEADLARSRAGAATGIGRRVRRTAERFRAWAAKRARWLRFLRAVRGSADPDGPWGRFLAATPIRIAPARLVASQLPWVGNRVAGGAFTSRVDWSKGDRRDRSAPGPHSGA